MRKLVNKWHKLRTVSEKGKVYVTHVCPRCKKEALVATNHCAHCGKRLIKKR